MTQLIAFFYNGLNYQTNQFVDTMWSTENFEMLPVEVWISFNQLVQNFHKSACCEIFEKELQIEPSEATTHLSSDLTTDMELVFLSLEPTVAPKDMTKTLPIVLASHVDKINRDLIVENYSDEVNQHGSDFIFGFDLIVSTHQISLHTIVSTNIFLHSVNHPPTSHLQPSPALLEGLIYFHYRDPYLINWKKRQK